MAIEQHIDLRRYPIADLDRSDANALVDRCKGELDRRGAYVLKGFLSSEAVAVILTELEGVLPRAFYRPKRHNPYLAPSDPGFPAWHPRNREQLTSSATLAYDHIGPDGLLEELYRWPPLQGFIARTLGYEALYPYADPLASINVLVYPPGTRTGWHFDNAHFVVTLMLQQGQRGGVYEYAPFIRSPDRENYGAIGAVLDGYTGPVHTLAQTMGDLVVFQGRYTLHRVTEVEGTIPRLIAVLSYDVKPGTTLSAHTRSTFYGRAAVADPVPEHAGDAD